MLDGLFFVGTVVLRVKVNEQIFESSVLGDLIFLFRLGIKLQISGLINIGEVFQIRLISIAFAEFVEITRAASAVGSISEGSWLTPGLVIGLLYGLREYVGS